MSNTTQTIENMNDIKRKHEEYERVEHEKLVMANFIKTKTRHEAMALVVYQFLAIQSAIAIVGEIQCGKSECSVILCYIMVFMNSLIRNKHTFACIGIKQLSHRTGFLEAIFILNDKLKAAEMKEIELLDLDSLKISDGRLVENKEYKAVLKRLHTNDTVKFAISYVGHKKMQVLNLLLEENKDKPNLANNCFMFFDESHVTTAHSKGSRVQAEFDKLLLKKEQVSFGVCSATAITNLAEDKIPICYVHQVEVGETYQGIDAMAHVDVPYYDTNVKSLVGHPAILKSIGQVASMEAVKDKEQYKLVRDTPQLSIWNVSYRQEHHIEIGEMLMESGNDFNVCIYNSEHCFIIFNEIMLARIITEGGYITITKKIESEGAVLEKQFMVPVGHDGQADVNSFEPCDILNMFQTYEAELVQRIAFIGSRTMSESVSMASSDRGICADVQLINQNIKQVAIATFVQMYRNCGYRFSKHYGMMLRDKRTTMVLCPTIAHEQACKYIVTQKMLLQALMDDCARMMNEMRIPPLISYMIQDYQINHTRLPDQVKIGTNTTGADRLSDIDNLTNTKAIEDRFKHIVNKKK